jgi:hypothetical protein
MNIKENESGGGFHYDIKPLVAQRLGFFKIRDNGVPQHTVVIDA